MKTLSLVPMKDKASDWMKVLYVLWMVRNKYLPADAPNGYITIPGIRELMRQRGWLIESVGRRLTDLRLDRNVDIDGKTFEGIKCKGHKLTKNWTMGGWSDILGNKKWRYV